MLIPYTKSDDSLVLLLARAIGAAGTVLEVEGKHPRVRSKMLEVLWILADRLEIVSAKDGAPRTTIPKDVDANDEEIERGVRKYDRIFKDIDAARDANDPLHPLNKRRLKRNAPANPSKRPATTPTKTSSPKSVPESANAQRQLVRQEQVISILSQAKRKKEGGLLLSTILDRLPGTTNVSIRVMYRKALYTLVTQERVMQYSTGTYSLP